jgi:hypothetical protein
VVPSAPSCLRLPPGSQVAGLMAIPFALLRPPSLFPDQCSTGSRPAISDRSGRTKKSYGGRRGFPLSRHTSIAPAIPGHLSVSLPGSPILTVASSFGHFPPGTRWSRRGLAEPETARFRLSSAGLGSSSRTAIAMLVQHVKDRRRSSRASTPDYDVFTSTGRCRSMPRIKAVSNSVMESKRNAWKQLRISSQRWHLVFILFQVAWNKGQHAC